MRTYLICFDITDDRIRNRLGRILLEYGERVQESVFEVALRDEAEYFRLYERLCKEAREETNIRFYRLCENCRQTSHTLARESVMRFPAAVIV